MTTLQMLVSAAFRCDRCRDRAATYAAAKAQLEAGAGLSLDARYALYRRIIDAEDAIRECDC